MRECGDSGRRPSRSTGGKKEKNRDDRVTLLNCHDDDDDDIHTVNLAVA